MYVDGDIVNSHWIELASNGALKKPSKLLVDYVRFLEFNSPNIVNKLKLAVGRRTRNKNQDLFFKCRLRARVNNYNNRTTPTRRPEQWEEAEQNSATGQSTTTTSSTWFWSEFNISKQLWETSSFNSISEYERRGLKYIPPFMQAAANYKPDLDAAWKIYRDLGITRTEEVQGLLQWLWGVKCTGRELNRFKLGQTPTAGTSFK